MWLVLAGCSFSGGDGSPAGDADAALADAVVIPDAELDAPPQAGIDFLPPNEETTGTVNWVIDTAVTLDTTALTITPAPVEAPSLTEGTQHDGLTKIAVLRLERLHLKAPGSITVIGGRPLFILAGNEVKIDGKLDVSARGAVAGPGGFAGGMGPGAGRASMHLLLENDTGGGGGSFGSTGAAGGAILPSVSTPGATYPISARLVGGASGGTAGLCNNLPGAGGGALLIYAMNAIDLKGEINAGGGGGAGGLDMDCAPGSGAGAGGGAGGAIWLQSKTIVGDGLLAANGGGGGGGSQAGGGNGNPGENGRASENMVAAGGAKGGGDQATAGGAGAVKDTNAAPVAGLNPLVVGGNTGGGGGGLGRIFYNAPTLAMTIKTSPAAVRMPAP